MTNKRKLMNRHIIGGSNNKMRVENDCYFLDGTFFNTDKLYEIEVYELPKPPFNWDDVKAGMAFTTTYNTLVYYIGQSLNREDEVITKDDEGRTYDEWFKHCLTRSPENDIEVE